MKEKQKCSHMADDGLTLRALINQVSHSAVHDLVFRPVFQSQLPCPEDPGRQLAVTEVVSSLP